VTEPQAGSGTPPGQSLVLGTAGHIDHGKSTLVKALTGTDPDRLVEEQRRGITIELGFARLDLPSGRTLGIVDVPGHERFVRHMVAGATGIDMVLLVVAADDDVMPQTREHLAVVDLLGIERGVVAITKADLADPDWLALVVEDVRALLADGPLAGAPIVPVSARTGQGLPELLAALDEVAAATTSRRLGAAARLPVDRVFTIAGAGTVVTGTLWSGRVKRDDQLEVLPGGAVARVRSVQVHGEPVAEAVAGQRAAVNVAGVEREDIERGDVLAAPGSLAITDRFDARFTYLGGLEGKPFASGSRVHVHHGTREVLGRVLLMDDAGEIRPGESAWAQVRLEEPLAPRYDDRFIVRSYSPVYTIGGGVVLDVTAPRRTRLSDPERALLTALAEHDSPAATVGLLGVRGIPMTPGEVATALGVPQGDVAVALQRSSLSRLAGQGESWYVDPGALERVLSASVAELRFFHEAHPTLLGMPVGALRDAVARPVAPRAFDAMLAVAAQSGSIVVGKGVASLPDAGAAAAAAEREAQDRVAALLTEQGLAPAAPADLADQAGVPAGMVRKALGDLERDGRVVQVARDLYFSKDTIDLARAAIEGYLRENPTMLAKDARDFLGTSRKYVVPLLEYFDAQGLTERDGDARALKA
jgi:selenocysteine-specific elongation factor